MKNIKMGLFEKIVNFFTQIKGILQIFRDLLYLQNQRDIQLKSITQQISSSID